MTTKEQKKKLEMIQESSAGHSMYFLITSKELMDIFQMLVKVLNDFTIDDVYQTHIEEKKIKSVLRQMVLNNQI
jgi:hypothetical protein